MNSGIAIAGSIIVDKINAISAYPNCGELTQIKSVQKAVGGCVPNDAIDIKHIDKSIVVKAVGKIGKDADGEFVKDVLSNNGVDVSSVISVDKSTSFTDVMSVVGGQRTFFTYAGANAEFGADDVDFDTLNVKMFHLGYFLLLDKIDAGDGEKLLKKAQEKGVKTSIDLVSENSDRYADVIPCLKYTDNLIINEIEAGNLTKIEPKLENLRAIAEKLKKYGVKERVIIHTSEIGVCLSNNGFFSLPSYDLPKGFIVGTTGAGDAFCSGALVGIYRDLPEEEILLLASESATSALTSADAVSGVGSEKENKELCKNLNRRKICL